MNDKSEKDRTELHTKVDGIRTPTQSLSLSRVGLIKVDIYK